MVIYYYSRFATWTFEITPNFDKYLLFENVNDEPESFSQGESTTITGHITYSPTYSWTPGNLRWEITIQNEWGSICRTSSGGGENISWVWVGKDNYGYNVPPGMYAYKIKASCDEKVTSYTQGTVYVKSPHSKVTRIEFLHSITLNNEDNQEINRIWNRGFEMGETVYALEPLGVAYPQAVSIKGLKQEAVDSDETEINEKGYTEIIHQR